MITTFASGEPVYSILSWQSAGSWCLALFMLILAAAFFTIWYFLTKFKLRKMELSNDSDDYSILKENDVAEEGTVNMNNDHFEKSDRI